jgi:DNA polymerase-3 subunit gamma/tau
LETPEEERAGLAAQGEALGAAAIVRALETLGEAAIEIRRAPDPRLVLEVTLVRLARRDVSSLEALADRLARLERALDDLRGGLGTGAAPAAVPRAAPAAAPERAVPAEPAAEAQPAGRAGPQAALGALRKKAASAGAAPPAAAATPAAPVPAAPAAQGGSAPAPPAPAAAAPPTAPAPAAEAAAEAGEGPLTLDHVTAAWAKALEGFKPRLKAMAKEAHPVRVDGDTVVLGIPPRFEKVHLPTITGETPTVTAALSELLGRRVRLNVVLDDNVVSPAAEAPPSDPPSAPDPGAGADEMVAEMARPPEPPGAGRGVDSPVSLVIETFGASVESETVRE